MRYPREMMIRWHIAIMEKGVVLAAAAGSTGVVVVSNTEHLGTSFRVAVPYMKAVSAIDQSHFPGHLLKVFVINTGAATRALFQMVSFFVSVDADRILMLGWRDSYEKALEAEGIDLDTLPVVFGGRGRAELPPCDVVTCFGCVDPDGATKIW